MVERADLKAGLSDHGGRDARSRHRSSAWTWTVWPHWRHLVRLGLSLDSAGSLSRRGTIRRMASRRPAVQVLNTRLLVDFNEQKLESASQIWPGLSFLNPFELRPSWTERLLLAGSLLLPDVYRRSLQAL